MNFGYGVSATAQVGTTAAARPNTGPVHVAKFNSMSTRVIAFYLPQYHPIPENDAWWGKGFTDWTNVAQATPLFPGQPQPRLPADLGFYDLRLPEARQAQAELAAAYGIYGFCYYHYWFNGRRLLERPFDEVLQSDQPDLPFCLCWANENWTRNWDGLDQQILIQQQYSLEDDRQHMRWLAKAFRDRRYIRLNDKPLFLVYRVSQLPDPKKTADVWRDEARLLGLGEIFLCNVESLRDARIDPAQIGFDAAVEFQPDWSHLGPPVRQTKDNNRIYDYAQFVERMLKRDAPAYRRLPCVTPAWDNTARRRAEAFIFTGSTPQLYQHWLETVLASQAAAGGGQSVVFINAWNEWAENAILEPCQTWGRAYLEATRDALQIHEGLETRLAAVSASAESRDGAVVKISVCLPLYNGAAYLRSAISSVLNQTLADLELVIVDDGSTDASASIVSTFQDPRLRYVRNSVHLGLVGNWNRCLQLACGQFVCIFHQDDLMLPDNLAEKVRVLDENPTVGLVYSDVVQIGPQDELIAEHWHPQPESGAGVWPGRQYFEELLLGGNTVCCPSAVARRKCFDDLGGFDSRLPLTADWEMWLRIALFYDVAYLPTTLIKYRRHEDNETLNYLGAPELEQYYRAKRIALEKYPRRVPNAERLRVKVTQEYSDLAVERARASYRQRNFLQAQRYMALAVQIQGSPPNTASDDRFVHWFLNAVDRLFQQELPIAVVNPAHAGKAEVTEPPSATRQPSRYRPGFRQFAEGLSGRDIAENIPFRKILQAIAFKLAGVRGMGWLYRFKGLAKRLLQD